MDISKCKSNMKNETCLSVASQSSDFQSTKPWSYGGQHNFNVIIRETYTINIPWCLDFYTDR